MSIEKIEQMMTIQNGLNTKSYDSAWLEKGKTGEFDYQVASAQELGEFMDSLPFAWWSAQTEDRQNCITELVDAWHFIMSQAIIDCDGDVELATAEAFNAWEMAVPTLASIDRLEVIARAKYLIAAMYNDEGPSVYLRAFFNLLAEYSVPFDLLFARYIGKATLNKFRQANGYSTKPRTYQKNWIFEVGGKGQEDNFHLSTFIDDCFKGGESISEDEVNRWLSVTYPKIVNSISA